MADGIPLVLNRGEWHDAAYLGWTPTHIARTQAEDAARERRYAIAFEALEILSDNKRSSMRLRDSNCVRYIADDALKALDALAATTTDGAA